MAKKKAAPAATKTPASKSPAPKSAAKKVAAPKASLALTNEDIGHVAGQVWQVLADGGAQTAAALKKSVNAPGDVVMAAVGWLAREEKLDFVNAGRTCKIALR